MGVGGCFDVVVEQYVYVYVMQVDGVEQQFVEVFVVLVFFVFGQFGIEVYLLVGDEDEFFCVVDGFSYCMYG